MTDQEYYDQKMSGIYDALRYYFDDDIVKTDSDLVLCSQPPEVWTSDKPLPGLFRVVLLKEVKNGTLVTITAGNQDNPRAELRNHRALVNNQVAEFHDLSFVGIRNSGKPFYLRIHIGTGPDYMVVGLQDAIEIVSADEVTKQSSSSTENLKFRSKKESVC